MMKSREVLPAFLLLIDNRGIFQQFYREDGALICYATNSCAMVAGGNADFLLE